MQWAEYRWLHAATNLSSDVVNSPVFRKSLVWEAQSDDGEYSLSWHGNVKGFTKAAMEAPFGSSFIT